MEKKRKNLTKMFTRWSMSYVVISIVAIGVILYCSMRYSQALREDVEYTNAVQMELTQLQMDRTVRNLRTFTNRANLNATVKRLRQGSSYETVSSYDRYKLVRDLANEMVFDTDTHECYLYFPASDFLISGRYYNDSKAFYEIAFEPKGFSYEDWYEVISREYRTPQIFSLDTQNGEKMTVLLKPLDITNSQVPPAYAIMVVNLNEVLKASTWINQERDFVCIVDRTNKQIVTNSNLDESLKQQILELTLENKERSFKNQQTLENSVVSVFPSRYENWDYVVMTQEPELVAQISDLQRLVAGMVLLYLLISGCAVGYAALKHYRPLQDMVDILQKEEGEAQTTNDAYEYINRSVHKLVDKNKEKNSVISLQRNAISKELFHRLLTEKNACRALDSGLLERYGIQVGNELCCILAYRMKKTADQLPEERNVDTQEMSWFILQNVTEENLLSQGFRSVSFRESEREQVFLIWKPGEEAASLHQAVKEAMKASMEFIRQHFKFPYQAALSEIHEGCGEIYQAYQEIAMVFEYQKKEEGRDVVSYGEINLLPKDTLLRYPIDVENRLAHSVGNGDAAEALREIRELLEVNQVNCLAPEAMQFLVSNIASSIIRAVGRVSRETGLPISQKALMEASRQNDREKVQEELERLVVTACREVTEFNTKERENQKGKLYQDVKAFAEAHYRDPELSVNSMAEQFQVQAAYLSKVFREAEGKKLSQYIHEVRLIHVKDMLRENAKLEDIAIQCGFGSQRTFLRIFKQYEGVTPTQYKELEEKKGKEEETS